jgi:endoglucanase
MNSPLARLAALALIQCACSYGAAGDRRDGGAQGAADAGSGEDASTPNPGVLCSGPGPSGVAESRHILVDQFGYRPGDAKVAVLSDPQSGFNAGESFAPGARYEVRRWADAVAVASGAPTAWNGGATEASSGDRGWWFDFSSVAAPGCYYVFDVEKNARSAPFVVGESVYREVLKAATRMFFYNRCGFAKRAPFAEACWTDDAAFLGPGQDKEARSVAARNDASTALDLSGGWFDAGDTNKYVTFASQPVHQLLTAYLNNPAIWTDDFNIPESGNGIPDVLDEVKWEIDWLRKMQIARGGVLQKLGTLQDSGVAPPSRDTLPRYYIPVCSSSTIAAAGMFAHASYVFSRFPALPNPGSIIKQPT